MKLTQYAQKAPQHVIVYGDGGTGKSTLVSQLAKAGFKLHWISCDNGHNVLLKLPAAAQENIDLIVLPDVRDYAVAVDVFRAIMKRPYKAVRICDTHGKVECSACVKNEATFSALDISSFTSQDILVWDNLSQLSDSYMNLITKGKAVDYKLQLDDWGALSFHLKAGLTEIQQFPHHFIGIAHAVEEKNTEGANKIMPMVGSSQFAPKVTGYFDHAVYCSVMNKSHRAGSATTYMINVLTKSRTDITIETLKELTLLPFFDGNIKPREQQGTKQAEAVIASISKPATNDKVADTKVTVMANSNTASNSVPAGTPVAGPTVVTPASQPAGNDAPDSNKPLTASERARLALKGLGPR